MLCRRLRVGTLPVSPTPTRWALCCEQLTVTKARWVTRCALRLAPLTFVRPGELRTAEWVHFRLDCAEWRIPAERMKMREDLIVPLSRQAMAVVRGTQARNGTGAIPFPDPYRSPGRPMSENTINGALRRLGYASDEMTGHGFRAMARTMLNR